MVYTSMDLQESRPLVEGFMRVYPFIRVDLYRSTGEDVAQRVISEYRGRRFAVDVIEGTGTDVAKVIVEGIGRTFYSPRAGGYPRQSRDPHGAWVATRYNMLVLAWHTGDVAAAEAPASYEDLLNPKWKGRIGMEADDQIWLAALMAYWGEQRGLAFFRRLGDQHLSWRRGHTLLAQLIVAGEVTLSPTIYNHRAESLRSRGAPIDWRALEPVVAFPNTVTLARRAPHPHAAMLFIDYLLAPEGQQALARLGRIPAHPFVKADPPYLNQGFVYRTIDPQRFLREYAKYNRIWQELLVRTR
ncbi:MAG: extracellular solute-binding protein [Armatimonadota bacterium]|nr:extracellular solute-binding protein [Armatimonadota bacterium]